MPTKNTTHQRTLFEDCNHLPQSNNVSAKAEADMSDPKTVKVFISHISEEQAEAVKAKDYLEQVFAGQVEVFAASSWTSIAPGQDWFQCITEAIENAEIMVVLCSGDSVNRPWIQFETGWMVRKENEGHTSLSQGNDTGRAA